MLNKITKIETQKKDKNRVSIFIDEKYAFGIYYQTLIKYDLSVGMIIDESLRNDIIISDEYNRALNDALHYLSYRNRTKYEVREKLKEKEYSSITIRKVIDELVKLKYVDDGAFAKEYIGFKIKKMGKRKIKYKLESMGIDSLIIDRELMEYSNEDEYLAAYAIASKKNDSYHNIPYKKRYSRLSGLLNRRGFSYSVAKDVIFEILEDYKKEENQY
jgi:regulatory protein